MKKPVKESADEYEDKLTRWREKHGVCEDACEELFIEPESDMDNTITQETEGLYTILCDELGWAERYRTTELRAHVKKHGKLATWDDFARLGALESEDL